MSVTEFTDLKRNSDTKWSELNTEVNELKRKLGTMQGDIHSIDTRTTTLEKDNGEIKFHIDELKRDKAEMDKINEKQREADRQQREVDQLWKAAATKKVLVSIRP